MTAPHHPNQGNEPSNAPPPPPQMMSVDQAHLMFQELHNQLSAQKDMVAQLQMKQSASTSSSLKPPKPDTFDGRNCDTFIYSMSKLFSFHGETDSERKVSLAVTYLRGSALRWYKCAEQQDSNGLLQQWPAFVEALKAFFEANNTQTLVRNKLANLKQLTSVARYNDAYNSLIIEVLDVDSRSKLDLYMRGLKPNVALHVTLKEPTDLETAQRVALNVDNILMETGFARSSQPRENNNNKFKNNNRNNHRNNNRFNRSSNNYNSNSQSVPMELGQAEDETQHDDQEQDDNVVVLAQANYKGHNRLSAEKQQKMMREGRCFTCGETGHVARECPQRNRSHPKND